MGTVTLAAFQEMFTLPPVEDILILDPGGLPSTANSMSGP